MIYALYFVCVTVAISYVTLVVTMTLKLIQLFNKRKHRTHTQQRKLIEITDDASSTKYFNDRIKEIRNLNAGRFIPKEK